MPIYEFRCLECNEFFEVLVMGGQDELEMKCPHCARANFERVLSSASHQVRTGAGASPSVQNRTCSGGTCSTITLPGPD